MSRKKVFKTVEEAEEYLFSEELESEMIVLPPKVDEFTDEEGFDDSETLDPSIRDVICPIISYEKVRALELADVHAASYLGNSAAVPSAAMENHNFSEDDVYQFQLLTPRDLKKLCLLDRIICLIIPQLYY
ncbi:hypothetical protein NPIL_389541 [Nephila pilipes]|uniref:Uncharacterized protein n=1 Tax=Nephila pilipes TaxID=299642 RepID=A0A8X6UPY5_NEPPI|nr:hypothetical protein NPIL_389541 [Nephila pilipes]